LLFASFTRNFHQGDLFPCGKRWFAWHFVAGYINAVLNRYASRKLCLFRINIEDFCLNLKFVNCDDAKILKSICAYFTSYLTCKANVRVTRFIYSDRYASLERCIRNIFDVDTKCNNYVTTFVLLNSITYTRRACRESCIETCFDRRTFHSANFRCSWSYLRNAIHTLLFVHCNDDIIIHILRNGIFLINDKLFCKLSEYFFCVLFPWEKIIRKVIVYSFMWNKWRANIFIRIRVFYL